ncbi:TadA family conjugal transfer-associated ATPase [Branchiibius hedensis]|uniref:TadA family conjugal transfer-associated ATPase n=1 Tax=Branchiibius hedensis TaxID=672460 RepID=UPI001FE7FB0D|nr:TadA family conjugal transfer-associated ATPase [Branchiibius hedensis]
MSTLRGGPAVTLWEQIRAGRSPDDAGVSQVAEADRAVLGDGHVARLRAQLHSDVLGAGPLEVLLADPTVTDVLVNGLDGVWVDCGRGLERREVTFTDAAQVRRLAVRLATLANRRLDESSPFVDGLLPGGIRLHAVLPPLVESAAHVSLRIPRDDGLDLSGLQERGAFDENGLGVLSELVSARVAFVVSGGTGSGKTTLLGALLRQVPAHERIVIVEDVRELRVDHPHVVRLEGRSANVEGSGEIALPVLVRQSLRMRPDRLVVGEVRGAEVRELLTALNTGHEGGCGTIHANTSADVVARFEALGALAGMAAPAVHSQLASAVSVVIHLRRAGGRRVVQEIGVLARAAGRLQVRPALVRAGDRLERADGWAQLRTILGAS